MNLPRPKALQLHFSASWDPRIRFFRMDHITWISSSIGSVQKLKRELYDALQRIPGAMDNKNRIPLQSELFRQLSFQAALVSC